MFYYTNWKKKTKIILSISLTAFYAALIAFVFLIKPSINTSGIGLPFGSNSGYTAFDSETGGNGSSGKGQNSGRKKTSDSSSNEERLPKKVQQGQGKGKGNNAVIYPILFFLFMLFLILWQNFRSKGKSNYENPYVDTNKYKLPLTPDAKMPMVHFLHIDLDNEEKINYATETNQKDNEGNFVITNKRIIIMNRNENTTLSISSVQTVSSVTSTVMVVCADEKKYYVFMPENQMKYAIAVLRWTAAKS